MKSWPKSSSSMGAGVVVLVFCLLTGCGSIQPGTQTDFPARDAPNY